MRLLWVVTILGVCGGLAPVRASSECDDAKRAFAEIEKMDRYVLIEGDKGLGLDDKSGRTSVLLDKILVCGRATDYLVRLSRSKNPVSRMAAAVGFGVKRSQLGRAILQQLKLDETDVEIIQGGEERLRAPVARYARESLMRYVQEEALPPK